MPLFAKGLIAPPNSVACTPAGSTVPQLNCTHDSSSVAVLPDGTLAAAWYHGVGDKSVDSHLLWSRLAPGSPTWSTPAMLYDDPQRAQGSPALWVAEDAALVAFYVTLYGSDWPDSRPFMIRSTDGGASWSTPVQLHDRCWMVGHRPLRLHSGDLLLPLYDSCLDVPVFMRSHDGGSTWQTGQDVSLVDHFQQVQPALIQRADDLVVALTRDSDSAGRIAEMHSPDDGVSWSPSRPTELPTAATAIDQLRLPSGHVVVVFTNSPDARFPLTAALSLDEGRTFAALRDLLADCPEGTGKCSYASPSIAYNPKDGTLWVTYTHNQQTIGWVHFSEAWLGAGEATAHHPLHRAGVVPRRPITPASGCVRAIWTACADMTSPMYLRTPSGLCASRCALSGHPKVAHCAP